MKSAIGVITAPADVFAQRYSEFYEDLASDSTGPSFAFLAAFVEKLTPQMFQALQNPIQRKLIEAAKVEHHMGITFFAWNVIKKQPKIFNYNQETFKTIAFNSLDFTFRQIYVEKDSEFSPEPAFRFFSANFNPLINQLIFTIEELKKKPPYKKQDILQLSIIQEFGRKLNAELICFFLDLLGCMIKHHDKGQKIQLDSILKMVAICLQNPNKVVHAHALDVLVHVAVVSQGYFARASNTIFEMMKNFDITPSILYKFLLNLNQAVGSQIDIVRFFPNVLTNFVDGLKIPGFNSGASDLLLIGRPNAEEAVKKIAASCQKGSSDFDTHAELIVQLIENNPSSLPVEPLFKIQKYVCSRVLTFKPQVIDLKLLNALLSVSNEKMPSPCQVARTVYSWRSINNDKELAPFAVIGRALCEAQRSSRFISYTPQNPEFNTSFISEATDAEEEEDKPMEVQEEQEKSMEFDEEMPQLNSNVETEKEKSQIDSNELAMNKPETVILQVPETENVVQNGHKNHTSSVSAVQVVMEEIVKNSVPVVEEVSDDDCIIIEEKQPSPRYVKTIDIGNSLTSVGPGQRIKKEANPSPMKSSSTNFTPAAKRKKVEDDVQIINPTKRTSPSRSPVEYRHPTSKSVTDMLMDFHAN